MNECLQRTYEFAQKAIDEINGYMPELVVLRATVEFNQQSDYYICRVSLMLSERSEETCYSFPVNIYWRMGKLVDRYSAVAVWVEPVRERRRVFESRLENLKRNAWLLASRLRDFVKKELNTNYCSENVFVSEED